MICENSEELIGAMRTGMAAADSVEAILHKRAAQIGIVEHRLHVVFHLCFISGNQIIRSGIEQTL